MYDEEYKDCKSFQARFQQYFVYGETQDCLQWKRDYENCIKFEDSRDLKAARELLDSEKNRRAERFKGHYGNDVWAKRNVPPQDWSKPLPELIQKEYETSYLAVKAKELRGEKVDAHSSDISTSGCVIM